jgi:hypothetical protein
MNLISGPIATSNKPTKLNMGSHLGLPLTVYRKLPLHLTTIDEEKHETQNSAFYREGGEETDQSQVFNDMKKSKILGDLEESVRH